MFGTSEKQYWYDYTVSVRGKQVGNASVSLI